MTYLYTNSFSPKEKTAIETSPAKQNNFSTSSYTTIDYSEIAFKPTNSLDKHVIYEYTAFMGKDGSGSTTVNLMIKLEKNDGNGWADFGDNTEVLVGSTHGDRRMQSIVVVRFILDSWGTSEVSLRLSGKRVNGDIRLHNLNAFGGESGASFSGSDLFYYPHIKCYSTR
tara:strand:+ start:666 stop:1172 length:507 start_codon:yes stop_codon:yes gene_type:complete